MANTVTERRPRFYGRRHGRSLSQAHQDRLDGLLPQIAISGQELGRGIDPSALFPFVPKDVWLEIGFGGGEHLAWHASHNLDIGLIGCEAFVNGVASLLQHVADQELKNVRVFPEDARRLLPALPDQSLARIFLLYPDPWPKTRHAERRFLSQTNLDSFSRLLKDGGELRMASDHPIMQRWMLEQMCKREDFTWTATRAQDWKERPLDWPPTRYEEKAKSKGAACMYFIFRRNLRTEQP